ncbi:hypothetical protein C448_05383 [Halococcus morrhuae DSM 1307]|uniref:Uncharacterized protein n=1 Tax=Halococcus morrhuae DSM 1307 TaxID=931277 RepID=M0MS64_HALMO|nr:hypothetical protein [Halococcus morrhuae]EMA47305.1 hypothetical protein C448_05383 [Halococcus morrhuae DSM 1307]
MAGISLPVRTDWLVIGLLGIIIVVSALVLYGETLFALAVFVCLVLFPILTMAFRRVTGTLF